MFVFPVLLSGHGIVFSGQLLDFLSKSWTLMIFVDPTSSAGCSRIPLLPTHRGDATTKGNRSTEGLCTERFIDWKLALDQTLGKKKQNKGLQPFFTFTQEIFQAPEGGSTFPYPALHG